MSTYKDAARVWAKEFSIIPASYTATTTGTVVDLTDAVEGTVHIDIGIGLVATADASNIIKFTVISSETSGGSYTAESETEAYDPVNGWDRIINATTEGSAIQSFNLHNERPFVKVVGTESDGAGGGGTTEAIYDARVVFTKRSGLANT